MNLDIKVQNDALVLFPILAAYIAQYSNASSAGEDTLSPRIILGLWHPAHIAPAKKYLPRCTRIHIGVSPSIARRYFWDHVEGFSIVFPVLSTGAGRRCGSLTPSLS